MTQAVFKYELETTNLNEFFMPEGAEPLTVGFQGTSLVLWARVNPHKTKAEKRRFVVLMTGQEFPEDTITQYVGTVQKETGNPILPILVLHVFEVV